MVAFTELNNEYQEEVMDEPVYRSAFKMPRLPRLAQWQMIAIAAGVIGVSGAIAMGIRTAAPDESVMDAPVRVTQEEFNLTTPADWNNKGIRLPLDLAQANEYKAGIYAFDKQQAKFDEELSRRLMIERASILRQAATNEVNTGQIIMDVPNNVFDMKIALATVNRAEDAILLRKAAEFENAAIEGSKLMSDPNASVADRWEGSRKVAAGIEGARIAVVALGIPPREQVDTSGHTAASVKQIQAWLTLLQSKAKIGIDAPLVAPPVQTIEQPAVTAPQVGGQQ
jgi:hypothetical protein